MSSASATKYLIVLLLALMGANAWAQAAGEVTHVSGPMFAVKTDGSKRVLSVASKVEPGETLITGEKTYSRVKFTDAGEVTLRPDTQFKIEAYDFKAAEPEKDGAVFGLLKGAMRTISGLIGKRGNQDAYKLQTPTATIGIRGTTVYAELVNLPGPASGGASPQIGGLDFPIRLAFLPSDGTGTMTDMGPELGQLLGLQLAQLVPGTPSPGPNLQTVVKFEAGHGFVAPRANPSLIVPVATGQTFGVPLAGTPIALPNPPNLNRFQPPQSFPRTSQAPPPPPPPGANNPQQQQQPQRQGQQQGQQQQDQQQSSQGQQQQSASSSQGAQGGQQGGQQEQGGGGSPGGAQPQQQQASASQQQQDSSQQQLTNRSGCNVR